VIPAAWPAVVILLGTFRIVRLIGWDDLPPIVRLRGWAIGAHLQQTGSVNDRMALTGPVEVESEWRYRRPLLAHFLRCPYCQGFWVSLDVYLAWLAEPRWTLYALAPFALSAGVGIAARMLDP
jgi:hypothetical protein